MEVGQVQSKNGGSQFWTSVQALKKNIRLCYTILRMNFFGANTNMQHELYGNHIYSVKLLYKNQECTGNALICVH
jgi:hypothetical protein